jgi:hypothetical protein
MRDVGGGFGNVQHRHGQHLLQRVLAVFAESRQNHRVIIEFVRSEHRCDEVHDTHRG